MDQDTLSTYLCCTTAARPGFACDVSLRIPVAGAPAVFDLLGNTRSRRDRVRARRGDAAHNAVASADRWSRAGQLQQRHRGRLRGAERRLGCADAVGRRDHRAPSAIPNASRRARAQLPRARSDGAALSPEPHRPRIRRRHREPYFVEGANVEWEEQSFSVNGSKWGSDRPAFPLLQAEKVLSLPFDLRLEPGLPL